MAYRVVLCGLTARDERLVEIILTRAPHPKYVYEVTPAGGYAQIAIVDNATAQADSQLVNQRLSNPQIVPVFISDGGLNGNSRYRIERRSLLLRVLRTLDEVVETELISGRAEKSVPAMQPSTAASQSTTPEVASSVPVAAAKPSAPQTTSDFAHSEKAFSSPNPQTAPTPSQYAPLRALVVDDSLGVREQLRGALTRIGILTDLAENAEVATVMLNKNAYDIAFLDVVMPGMDGYELCRKIKHNAYTRGIPVVMLTSRSSPFDRARGALAGCDSYLIKPITWDGFYKAIDKALNKHFRHDPKLLVARGYRALA